MGKVSKLQRAVIDRTYSCGARRALPVSSVGNRQVCDRASFVAIADSSQPQRNARGHRPRLQVKMDALRATLTLPCRIFSPRLTALSSKC
jgi:hypothetical protein